MNRIFTHPELPEAFPDIVDRALAEANQFAFPQKQTGEIRISASDYAMGGGAMDESLLLYHATLPEGKGNSCSPKKTNTLFSHPKYKYTGDIPEEELNKENGEVPWLGAIRLAVGWKSDNVALHSLEELIIEFSDRMGDQDCRFVANVIVHLRQASFINFLNVWPECENHPIWGDALAIFTTIQGYVNQVNGMGKAIEKTVNTATELIKSD